MALISNLVGRLTLDSRAFDRNARRAAGSMRSMQRQSLSLQRAVVRLAGAYLGARGLTAAIRSVTAAGMQQQAAERQIQAALAKTHDATVGNIRQIKEYAAALQRQTVYGDEVVLQEMAYAKNLGVTTDKLGEATQAAIGLAAKLKIDLHAAMMLVGRASQGQTQTLTRYGLVIDQTMSAQDKFNAVLKLGRQAMSLARAETETAQGAAAQLTNAWGDAKEALARGLLPTMKTTFETLTIWLEQNQADFERWSTGVVHAFDWVSDKLIDIGNRVAQSVAGTSAEELAQRAYRQRYPQEKRVFEPIRRGGTMYTPGIAIPSPVTRRQAPVHEEEYQQLLRQAETALREERTRASGYKSIAELHRERISGRYEMPKLSVTPSAMAPGETAGGGAELVAETERTTVDVAAAYRRMLNDIDTMTQKSFLLRKVLLIGELKANLEVVEDQAVAWEWYYNELEKLNIQRAKASQDMVQGFGAGIAEMQRNLQTWGETGAQVAETLRDGIVNALADAVLEARNLSEAFKALARDIARILLQQALTNIVTAGMGGFGKLFGVSEGAAFERGHVMPFERGGLLVDRPTLFPMARGMGLMGEKGPEAVLPLARDAGGRLGVRSQGTSDREVVGLLHRIAEKQMAVTVLSVSSREEALQVLRSRQGEEIVQAIARKKGWIRGR